MGMTFNESIRKLDFSIGAYKKLIEENVSNGDVVGTGVRGVWTSSTPLNKAYSDMIEALQTAKDTMRKYQKIKEDLNKIIAEMHSRLDGVNITLDVLVENDPLIPKMEAAKTTLEECLSIIAKYTQKEAADDQQGEI